MDQAAKTGHAETEAVALSAAAQSDTPVVVDGYETPTSETQAEPGGYLQATEDISPVRRKVDDTWKPLNATLAVGGDGLVEPKLAMGDLKISDGGAAGSMIASYTSGADSYEVTSPFPLPKPTLLDDSAVFTDVLDTGVDLVVKAGASGFNFDWVVKTAAAAADPRIAQLNVGVNAPGVRPVSKNGGTYYDTASGVHKWWSPQPIMWDSSTATSTDQASATPSSSASATAAGKSAKAAADPADETSPSVDPTSGAGSDDPAASVAAVAAGPDAGTTAPVGVTATSDAMKLVPDAGMLASSSTTFPLVIDPVLGYINTTLSDKSTGWAAVWDIYPTTSFWKTAHSLGAGYEGYSQDKVVRSYFQFNTAGIKGKHILVGHLHLDQIWDASCTARSTQVYRTNPISTSTTWHAQPSRMALQSTVSSTAGCNGSPGDVVADVTTAVTNIAANNVGTGTFMVKAADETDKIAWKQFEDAGGSLVVAYVSKPNAPAVGSMSITTPNAKHQCTTATVDGAHEFMIGTSTIGVAATVTSADGGNASLSAVIQLHNRDTGATSVHTVGTFASGGIATLSNWNVGQYDLMWNVYTKASWTYNGVAGSLNSVASPWCVFKTDATKPPAPKVTSTAFHVCSSTTTSCVLTAQGDQGKVATNGVTLTSLSSDTKTIGWDLNGKTTTASVTALQALPISLLPLLTKNHLKVWAIDSSGNQSESGEYDFVVIPLDSTDEWNFETDATTGVTGTGDGTENGGMQQVIDGTTTTKPPLTLTGATLTTKGRTGAAPQCVPSWAGHECGGLHTGAATGQRATSADTAVTTGGNFTISFWAHLNSSTASTVVAATTSSTTTGDPFEIGYDPATKAWVAGRRANGATSITGVSAPGTAVEHAWTQVTVTYNEAVGDGVTDPARTVTIYINGVQKAQGVLAAGGTANTGWWLGCGANSATTPARCGDVDLDEVKLYNADYTPEAVEALVAPQDPANPLVKLKEVSTAAHWAMGTDADPNDTTAPVGANGTTESEFGDDLTVSTADAPVFGPPADTDANGFSVMTLSGASDQAAGVDHTVVDSTASFTVTAHVALSDTAKSAVIAEQSDASGVAWLLAYRYLRTDPPDDTTGADGGDVGEFVFERRTSVGAAPASAASYVEVRTKAMQVDPGDFHSLAGIYAATDPSAPADDSLELYLDGSPLDLSVDADETQDIGAAAFTTAWQEHGSFQIGNGLLDDGTQAPLNGMVDDIAIYAGAFDGNPLSTYTQLTYPDDTSDSSDGGDGGGIL